MPSFSFSKFSPAGNTTLLLEGEVPVNRDAAVEAMNIVMAEQAGIASLRRRHLEMAGGEFCVNACRAFGALLDMQACRTAGVRTYTFTVSGHEGPVTVEVEGAKPCWTVEARFEISCCPMELTEHGQILVHFPGISHLLIRCETFPDSETAQSLAMNFRNSHKLDRLPASGVIWWRHHPQYTSMLEIMPLVHVSGINTSILESSCGSGSIALAMAMRAGMEKSCLDRGGPMEAGEYRIWQPARQMLEIRFYNNRTHVRGPVALQAVGQLWLEKK